MLGNDTRSDRETRGMAFRKSEAENASIMSNRLNLDQLKKKEIQYTSFSTLSPFPNRIITLRETKPEGLNAEAGAACVLTSSTTGTTLVSLLL